MSNKNMLFLLCMHFALGIDFSISGFSSGGCMAMQMHIAHSSQVSGVGILGGVPYHCAQSLPDPSVCLLDPKNINITKLISYARKQESIGTIDSLLNLPRAALWVQGGTRDTMVPQDAVRKIQEFYEELQAQVTGVYNINSIHAFITDNFGNPCWYYAKPYISNCKLDAAGEILKLTYKNLNNKGKFNKYHLYEFSQKEFINDDTGMDDFGYIYAPDRCKGQVKCEVHMFLHGCGMNTEYIGESLIYYSGFNEWAETNDLIIIYPQAARHHPFNHGACWDATGSNDINYATKQGKQLSALYSIIQNIHSILISL